MIPIELGIELETEIGVEERMTSDLFKHILKHYYMVMCDYDDDDDDGYV